jgi:hypothetical protein
MRIASCNRFCRVLMLLKQPQSPGEDCSFKHVKLPGALSSAVRCGDCI